MDYRLPLFQNYELSYSEKWFSNLSKSLLLRLFLRKISSRNPTILTPILVLPGSTCIVCHVCWAKALWASSVAIYLHFQCRSWKSHWRRKITNFDSQFRESYVLIVRPSIRTTLTSPPSMMRIFLSNANRNGTKMNSLSLPFVCRGISRSTHAVALQSPFHRSNCAPT